MKRIISLLCVLSMVLTSCFLFSSCSKNSEENTITIWAYCYVKDIVNYGNGIDRLYVREIK